MTTTIASLQAVIGADITGLTRGLDQAKSSLTGFGKDIKKSFDLGSAISNAGAALTGLTAPLAAFGAIGLHTASNFSNAMAEISARTGLVGKDLEDVRNFALKMGADTSFSAQQAAEGLLQLLASGQTTAEALATLPAVMDAAAASGENLGHTADMVTDIMAAFQLPVSEATNVVNSLSKAAGASSADIASLGLGFGNVAGVARKFGLTVDDTAAALAILSENGVKGAEAGTALRSMLNHMIQDTDAVQGAWNDLGTSLFDATGNIRPLKDVMADIKVAMSGMTEERQVKIMHDLVGTYGQLGLTALTSSISIDEMKARMGGASSAADVASARMNTFAGRVESLKGSIEALQIKALTPLMDKALAPMVANITKVVNEMGEWITANPALTENIVKLLAVITTLGPTLFAVGKAFTFITGPLGLLVAGISALALAFDTNFLGIRDAVIPVVKKIQKAVGLFSDQFGDFAKNVKKFGLSKALESALNLGDGKKYASGWIQGVLEALGVGKEQAGQIVTSIKNALMPLANIVDDFYNAFNIAQGNGFNLFDSLLIGAQSVVPHLQELIGNLISGIGAFIRDNASKVETAVGDMLSNVGQFISDSWPKVGAAFQDILGKVGDWLGSNGPGDLARGLMDMMKGAADWLIDTGWPTFRTGIESIASKIGDFFKGEGWNKFVSGIGAMFGNAKTWLLKEGVPNLINGIANIGAEIYKFFTQGGWENFKSGVSNMFTNAINWIQTVGIPKMTNAFADLVREIAKEIAKIQIHIQNAVTNAAANILGYSVTVGPTGAQAGLSGPGSGGGKPKSTPFKSKGSGFTPFAAGGFAPIGTRFMAGEVGPEMGVVGASGTMFKPMYPRSAANGGGGTKQVTATIYVMDHDLETRLEAFFERELAD